MKIDWAGWDTGRRIVFIAACIALVSFLLPWSKPNWRATITYNGFSQGWPLLGLGAFGYVLVQQLRGQSVGKMIGYACAAVALILGIVFVLTTTFETAVKTFYVSEWGSYVYIASTVALGVGVHMTE